MYHAPMPIIQIHAFKKKTKCKINTEGKVIGVYQVYRIQ